MMQSLKGPNDKNLFHFISNKHLIAPSCLLHWDEEQLASTKMISNKNETSIPSAGQITSHENPHIKIGQKTQFMMSHKYLEFNCVFVVIYNEKKLCRVQPRYWEWIAWIKPYLSVILTKMIHSPGPDNPKRLKLTWHGLLG